MIIDVDKLREDMRNEDLGAFFVGGFGGAVAEVMAESAGRKARLLRIGLNDEYSVRVGNQKYLRQQYGMDAAAITERIVREVSKDE